MTKEEKWTAVLARFDKVDQKVSLAEYKTKERNQNKTLYASLWVNLDLNNDSYFDYDEFKSMQRARDMQNVTPLSKQHYPSFYKLLMSGMYIEDKWANLLQFFDDKDQKISEEEFFGKYSAQNDADDPGMILIKSRDFEANEGNFDNCITCDLFHPKKYFNKSELELEWNKFDENNDGYVSKEEFLSNEGMSEVLKKMMERMNEHMQKWINTFKRRKRREKAENLRLSANYGLFLKLYDKKDRRVSREEYFDGLKEEKIWIFENLPQEGRQYDKQFNETFVEKWNQLDHNPKDDYLEKEEFLAADFTNIDSALTTYLQLDDNGKSNDDKWEDMLNLFDKEDRRISQEEYLLDQDMSIERALANYSARKNSWDEFDKDGNDFIHPDDEFPSYKNTENYTKKVLDLLDFSDMSNDHKWYVVLNFLDNKDFKVSHEEYLSFAEHFHEVKNFENNFHDHMDRNNDGYFEKTEFTAIKHLQILPALDRKFQNFRNKMKNGTKTKMTKEQMWSDILLFLDTVDDRVSKKEFFDARETMLLPKDSIQPGMEYEKSWREFDLNGDNFMDKDEWMAVESGKTAPWWARLGFLRNWWIQPTVWCKDGCRREIKGLF